MHIHLTIENQKFGIFSIVQLIRAGKRNFFSRLVAIFDLIVLTSLLLYCEKNA